MSSTPSAPKINWLVSMGDSLTCSDATLYIPKNQQYAYLVKSAIGGICRERNLGIPGNTTTQMLARINDMLTWGVPSVATIYGATNDPGSSISSATTQSNLQSMVTTLQNAGCTRIMLLNLHTPAGTDSYGAYRTAIQNVATATGAAFCDLFTGVTLVNPTDYYDTGSSAMHLNAGGLQKLANKIKADLDTLGWTNILKGS